MGANDTLEQLHAAQTTNIELEAERDQLKASNTSLREGINTVAAREMRLLAEAEALRTENARLEGDIRKQQQLIDSSTVARNYFGLLQERNDLERHRASAVAYAATLHEKLDEKISSWAEIICLQFSSDVEYTGSEVIGRVRSIVHAAEYHEPGKVCLICENDPAVEY